MTTKTKAATKNSLVANPTDPDSRVMKQRYTYLQGYNAQAVVSEDHIVLAAAITQGRPAPAASEARSGTGQPRRGRGLGEHRCGPGRLRLLQRGQPGGGRDGGARAPHRHGQRA